MSISNLVRKDFLKFDGEDTVHTMAAKLKLTGRRGGLVFHGPHYVGVVNRRLLLQSSLTNGDAKLMRCTTKTPIVPFNAQLLATAKLMYVGNMRFLPVERNGHVVGIVTALDVLKALSESAVMQGLTLADVKISKPQPLKKNDRLSKALAGMHYHKVDHLPIFEGKELLGVLSLADLMEYFVYKNKKSSSKRMNKSSGVTSKGGAVDRVKLSGLPALSFATTQDLLTIKRSDSLADAVEKMSKHDVRDLIVKEEGKVYGLVTIADILAQLATSQQQSAIRVEVVGANKTSLYPEQVDMFRRAAESEGQKIQRKLRKDLTLKAHLKEKKKSGKKRLYEVKLHVEAPGLNLNTTQEDWDEVAALHKGFAALKKAVSR